MGWQNMILGLYVLCASDCAQGLTRNYSGIVQENSNCRGSGTWISIEFWLHGGGCLYSLFIENHFINLKGLKEMLITLQNNCTVTEKKIYYSYKM